jgi:Ca2+-binding EF-hand superfamily protein
MLCGQEKISFTYFLVIFGEKLINMDRDSVIKQAFETLDQEGLGKIDVDILREQLTTMGDRLTDEECAEFLKDDAAYIDRKSNTFDYDKFISKMTAGAEKD